MHEEQLGRYGLQQAAGYPTDRPQQTLGGNTLVSPPSGVLYEIQQMLMDQHQRQQEVVKRLEHLCNRLGLVGGPEVAVSRGGSLHPTDRLPSLDAVRSAIGALDTGTTDLFQLLQRLEQL